MVEEGETPAAAAAREAVEESGWAPLGPAEPLVAFQPLPGNATARVEVFLWHQFEHVGEPSDTEEASPLEWVPLARVPDLASRGELLGSGTLVAALYLVASRPAARPPLSPFS